MKRGLDLTTPTLTAIKERFEVYIRSMESMRLAVPMDEEQAADFLVKLNDDFSNRRNVVENSARLGGKFPTTLFEAYKIVSDVSEMCIVNVAIGGWTI